MTARLQSLARSIAAFGWYPLLLALAWYLEAFAVGRVAPEAAVRSLVILVAASLLVTAVSIRLLGRERGSFAAALLLIALIAARSPLLAVPFALAIVILLVERRWASEGRTHLPWRLVHETLTIGITVLFALQIGRVATVSDPSPMVDRGAWAAEPLSTDERPDVYLILADAHGRHDVLDRLYGYDDGPFLGSLEALGFDVASASRSNYALTRFSLGSMFTSTYLDPLNSNDSTVWQDDFARRTIYDNPAFPLLRRAGYDVTAISSGYEHLGLRSADRFVDTGQPNEFEAALIKNLAATAAWDAVVPDHTFAANRERTRDELAALVDIAGRPAAQPRFVFTHLPVPHWPFVFDANCRPAPPMEHPQEGLGHGGGGPESVAATAAQTRCVDRLLMDAVGELVRRAPDAVVIVFSDHGPDDHLDWWNPDQRGLDERSANLFAARTPGRPDLYPDDVTLVNLLPILFNGYLGTELPLKANEFWFGPLPQDKTFVSEDLG